MPKDVVMVDRGTFFMGILFAVAIVLVGYYAINKYFNKDKAVPTPYGVPQPPKHEASLEKSPHVLDLQSDSDAVVAMTATGTAKVVLVHAPWCGHCKNMMGAFIQAASMEPKTTWMRADGNTASSLVRREDLRGFPSIYGVMADGTIKQHLGSRDVNSLIEFSKSLHPLPKPVEVLPVVEEIKEEEVKVDTVIKEELDN